MLKKWGFILLSLVIVMGCSEETEGKVEVAKSEVANSKTVEEAETTTVVQSAAIETNTSTSLTLEESEYLAFLDKFLNTYMDTLEVSATYISTPIDSTEWMQLLKNNTMKVEITGALFDGQTTAHVPVPVRFEEMHEQVLEGIRIMDLAGGEFIKGYENRDETLLNEGASLWHESLAHLNIAIDSYAELKKHN